MRSPFQLSSNPLMGPSQAPRQSSPRLRLLVNAAALIVGVCCTLAGCGSIAGSAGTFTPGHRGVLTVATSAVPSAGFWEGTPRHPSGGFEYELAREFAARFGLGKVRVRIVHFHRMVEGHLGGADIGLNLLTPTEKREQFLDFSAPYLKAAPTVLVRSGTEVPDLESAQKLRWGVVRATTFVEAIANSISPETPTRLFDGQRQVLNALEAGKIDATMFDLPLAVATARLSRGRLEAVAQLPQPEALSVALPKGSSNQQAIDSAIRAFTANGTIERLLNRWVGADAADAESTIPLLHTTR